MSNINAIEVKIIKIPTIEDWQLCKRLALNTVGKKSVSNVVNDDWKKRILKAEHSPIRCLNFVIEMKIPYYVSVHFARHKFGVEHFVSTQRNDRQNNYDRTIAPQSMMVTHIMYLNAQALINMSRKRLCSNADTNTRYVMSRIVREVVEKCPEFDGILVPDCAYRNGCNEFKSCGFFKSNNCSN